MSSNLDIILDLLNPLPEMHLQSLPEYTLDYLKKVLSQSNLKPIL